MGKRKVREIQLYSEKVKEGEVKNLFNQILRSKMPLFRGFFSPNFINIIIKRKINTVRFFARESRGLANMPTLVFPYKIADSPQELEEEKGRFFHFPKLYLLSGSQDFLSFIFKEKIAEVDLKIWSVAGKLLGFGFAVDEKGKKSVIAATSPARFLEVDLEKHPSVYIEILDPIPKKMSVVSRYPVFEEGEISIGPDNFDIFQHSLIVGSSGAGKSKGLYALIKAIDTFRKDNVRIVIIDPHGEFARMMSGEHIVDFIDNYIEPMYAGEAKVPAVNQLISQLLSSSIGGENKYAERVIFYSVHLLSSSNSMSLKNLSLLISDANKRAEFLASSPDGEIKRFFESEFGEIYKNHFNDAILPILNFVGEYELYFGKGRKEENLLNLIRNNKINIISFNPKFFSKRMIRFLAGSAINQMYALAITEKLAVPTILVIDEFQHVETKVLKDILSETRKFNLYAYVSLQHLGQFPKEMHESIVSSMKNIIAFRLNKQDAAEISPIIDMKIEESFKKAKSQAELEESKKEMFVHLQQRECIVRLFDGNKYILPMKLRVVDTTRWGYSGFEQPLRQSAPEDGKGAGVVAKEGGAKAPISGYQVSYTANGTANEMSEEERKKIVEDIRQELMNMKRELLGVGAEKDGGAKEDAHGGEKGQEGAEEGSNEAGSKGFGGAKKAVKHKPIYLPEYEPNYEEKEREEQKKAKKVKKKEGAGTRNPAEIGRELKDKLQAKKGKQKGEEKEKN